MEIRNLIWLRKGDTAEYGGFIGGNPLKIFRNRKSGPFSIVVNEGWCCARNLGSIRLYKLAENHGRLEYKLEKRIMQFKGMTVPSTRMASVFFKVKHDKYSLRSSPEIIDQPSEVFRGEMFIGNIIAEFPKGSRGEAIAEHRDKTGRVWWFVLMDKNATTTINHFYDDKDSYKMGWMSSRYLDITK